MPQNESCKLLKRNAKGRFHNVQALTFENPRLSLVQSVHSEAQGDIGYQRFNACGYDSRKFERVTAEGSEARNAELRELLVFPRFPVIGRSFKGLALRAT